MCSSDLETESEALPCGVGAFRLRGSSSETESEALPCGVGAFRLRGSCSETESEALPCGVGAFRLRGSSSETESEALTCGVGTFRWRASSKPFAKLNSRTWRRTTFRIYYRVILENGKGSQPLVDSSPELRPQGSARCSEGDFLNFRT